MGSSLVAEHGFDQKGLAVSLSLGLFWSSVAVQRRRAGGQAITSLIDGRRRVAATCSWWVVTNSLKKRFFFVFIHWTAVLSGVVLFTVTLRKPGWSFHPRRGVVTAIGR